MSCSKCNQKQSQDKSYNQVKVTVVKTTSTLAPKNITFVKNGKH